MNTDMLDRMWRFVRGDTPTEIFETWAYGEAGLEDALGSDAYLDLISVYYGDSRTVANLKAQLAAGLLHPASCQCHTVPDRGLVRWGEWSSSDFEVVEREADGLPWLHRLRCATCDTTWLIAAEELVYDVWLLSRQTGTDWPEVRTYRGVMAAALSLGAWVRYLDPFHSMELPKAMRALASEAPGITLTELVELLPLDRPTARQIAMCAMTDSDIRIDLER